MEEFTCFYCGQTKGEHQRSDEHVVPSCIGGSRNATLTRDVCDVCNQAANKKIDLVFCRDWFIESARLLAGIKHRQRPSLLFMGQVAWDRRERLTIYQTEFGGSVLRVADCPDGVDRVLVTLDPASDEQKQTMTRILKSRFSGTPVINASPHVPTEYDNALIDAIASLETPFRVTNRISIVAWHREIVKMALGLACMTLGPPFVTSIPAQTLRTFMWEEDNERRTALRLRGTVGLGDHTAPRLTKSWHPGDDQHLFALVSLSDRLVFVANLFGKFENLIEVVPDDSFNALLPGDRSGVAWIVDGVAKSTVGPTDLSALIRRSS